MSKKAIIFGVSGQDGSFLSEFLLNKNYLVYGVSRSFKSFKKKIETYSIFNKSKRYKKNFKYFKCDISDYRSVKKLIKDISPNEIYNFASQSSVNESFKNPRGAFYNNSVGTFNILEVIRFLKLKVKYYQAGSSEIYGNQNKFLKVDKLNFNPMSPYATSKLFSFFLTKNYREIYGIHAINGILFNHESERRDKNFVSRKITSGLVEICLGLKSHLKIGNLSHSRDWGYAKEYVEGIWRMLQYNKPEDQIIATGKTTTIKKFIEISSKYLGFEIAWSGSGINEIGYVKNIIIDYGYKLKIDKLIIKIDKSFYRPTDISITKGNFNKIYNNLNWKPKVDVNQLIKIMINNDLEYYKKNS